MKSNHKEKKQSDEITCSRHGEKRWTLIDKIVCGTTHEKVQIEVGVDRVGEYCTSHICILSESSLLCPSLFRSNTSCKRIL